MRDVHCALKTEITKVVYARKLPGEGRGARAPVPHSWRRQWRQLVIAADSVQVK